MRTTHYFKEIVLVTGIAFILTMLLSKTSFSQDKAGNKEPKGTVRLRIEKDENGQKTVIDTSFNLNDKKGKDGYEIFMKEHGTPAAVHDKAMKEVEIRIKDLGKTDSLDLDSLAGIEKNIRVFTDDGKHFSIEGLGDAESFDVPEPPAPPEPPMWMDNDIPMPSGIQEGSGNLLDVLRSIPMNRVRNFSIKENKHDTRIIIDVDRSSILEMAPMQHRMMYMNHPGQHVHQGHSGHQKMERRIIIEKENEGGK